MAEPKIKSSKSFYMGGEPKKDSKLILPENKIISEENYETFLKKQKEKAEQDVEFERQKKEHLAKQYIEQYDEFVKDESYLEDYNKFCFVKGDVLVRIFRLMDRKLTNNITEGGIYIPEESQDGITRITSYAKVIALGNVTQEFSDMIEVGDIVKLTDHITGVKENPRYQELVEKANERGTGVDPSRLPELKDVPMYISNLSDWDQYNLRSSIVDYTDNDALTYLIPQSFIIAKIEK